MSGVPGGLGPPNPRVAGGNTAETRSVWLRRCSNALPDPPGQCFALSLSDIGAAAARETLLIRTPHMAAFWTDLFRSMLGPPPELRWAGHGPGVGRDAKTAYSGLLGRYLARAYLTAEQRVRILVPLDLAKEPLRHAGYTIEKDPPGQGYEADWLGLDDVGLVIVEAKGSSDRARGTWHHGRPGILHGAKGQVRRTAVFASGPRRKLPARRWVVASRWGTQEGGLQPTLLAWDPEETALEQKDLRRLEQVLLEVDLGGLMEGLGHAEPGGDTEGTALQVRVGDYVLPLGFVAMAGPFGILPVRQNTDLPDWRLASESGGNIAVLSLSVEYENAVRRLSSDPDGSIGLLEQMRTPSIERSEEAADLDKPRFDVLAVNRSGLTVVWPKTDERIELVETQSSG